LLLGSSTGVKFLGRVWIGAGVGRFMVDCRQKLSLLKPELSGKLETFCVSDEQLKVKPLLRSRRAKPLLSAEFQEQKKLFPKPSSLSTSSTQKRGFFT
jgi:hypothetical protein